HLHRQSFPTRRSSDLSPAAFLQLVGVLALSCLLLLFAPTIGLDNVPASVKGTEGLHRTAEVRACHGTRSPVQAAQVERDGTTTRSEEHTSELQSPYDL